MNARDSVRRNVRLVGIGAMLTAGALVIAYLYSLAIYRSNSPGPVEQWVKLGCELHQLLEVDAAGVVLTAKEYKTARERLAREEDVIASHGDFPRDVAELARYEQTRDKSPPWTSAFWFGFLISVMTAIAAAAWLEGASFAAREASSELEVN